MSAPTAKTMSVSSEVQCKVVVFVTAGRTHESDHQASAALTLKPSST